MTHPDVKVFLKTLESAEELAATIVKAPGDTIVPATHASQSGRQALEDLQRVAVHLDGRVTPIRTLGEGGMGVVHLATQATLGRHVAVKTLRRGAGDVDATLRILREAWVTGALEHPNVVPIYDVGVDATGSPQIVMKRVEGRAWADVIADAEGLRQLMGMPDPLEANLRVFVAVCNAIHFAHSRKILHRDIKPENVMIGPFGEVYVLDWGIAVSLEADPSGRLPHVSQATQIAGTPSYMAPEMLHADPARFSPRTDVYLLGAVLYEVFSGRPPHVGATMEAMVSSILVSKPEFGALFPSEGRGICEKALAAEAEERFESVEALRVAVEAYLAHRGSRKLAWEAKKSLGALLDALAEEPNEERNLAIFNLLGECRFGYRAALSAWPENVAARRGLDKALLAVVEHELAEGDPAGAATLLREAAEPPADVVERVENAVAARALEDERLKKLGQDLDPEVGTRTRVFIGGIFGVLWTATPLAAWFLVQGTARSSHGAIVGLSAAFLALGGAFRLWARETLTKTLLNRRLVRTMALHLGLQILLGTGAWIAGMTPQQSNVLHIVLWCSTQTLMAVWLEPRLFIAAAASAVTFLVSCAYPSISLLLMSGDNLVFTLVLVRVWTPKADRERFAQRRAELHRRARRLFLDAAGRPQAPDEHEGAA